MMKTTLFRYIVKPEETTQLTELVKSTIGLLAKGLILFEIGMQVKSFNGLACNYFPYSQRVHVQSVNSFGYFLTKEEYREEIRNLSQTESV